MQILKKHVLGKEKGKEKEKQSTVSLGVIKTMSEPAKSTSERR